MIKNFTAVLQKTDDGWWAIFAEDFPGAYSQGRTKQEALENLQDAIELLTECHRDELLEDLQGDYQRESLSFTTA